MSSSCVNIEFSDSKKRQNLAINGFIIFKFGENEN